MKPVTYPFAAIVGQEQMKLALLLAAIDWRVGVLLRGDKGSGKTTTARGLAELLPEPAPFINLPIGVTEDRLLGGLHLESTLQGNPVLKPGLLSQAHGGVLYIDEVNLLPAHLGDALLDAAASGVNVVEREGFSVSHPAEFVLLGSMNPEEGLLRPQLLDRFALSVDIAAPLEVQERQAIVERRVEYEHDSVRFAATWASEQQELREKIRNARDRVRTTECSSEVFAEISAAICAAGVRSLRADLAAVRASIACAALMGDSSVERHHLDAVLPLVLNHRAQRARSSNPPPPASHARQPDSASQEQNASDAVERIFKPREITAPVISAEVNGFSRTGMNDITTAERTGPVVGSRTTNNPRELDLRATLTHAALEHGSLQPRMSDLHEKVRAPKTGTRYVVLIDSSGSHAEHEKMRLVKGATLGLLRRSFRKGDEVTLIAFRGTAAQILLEPSQQLEDAEAALEYLPTGGRTPLAHALELAKNYLSESSLLVILSDGRANVALSNGDPWQEALEIASHLHGHALIVDTETSAHPVKRASELAKALKARVIALTEMEALSDSRIALLATD